MVDEIVAWLNTPQLSAASKVGTLSSSYFLGSPQIHSKRQYTDILLADDMCGVTNIYTTYCAIKTSSRRLELYQISDRAGQDFLKFLDRELKPDSLKTCSKGDFQALFLLLFGTILAVGYNRPMVKVDLELNEVSSAFASNSPS